MPYTDLFLYDIKSMDTEIHRKYTGVGNELILENLAKLLELKANIWVRVPVIPSNNATEENFKEIKAFFDKNSYPAKFELLPYHAMGEHKYEALRMKSSAFDVPTKEKLDFLKNFVVPY